MLGGVTGVRFSLGTRCATAVVWALRSRSVDAGVGFRFIDIINHLCFAVEMRAVRALQIES